MSKNNMAYSLPFDERPPIDQVQPDCPGAGDDLSSNIGAQRLEERSLSTPVITQSAPGLTHPGAISSLGATIESSAIGHALVAAANAFMDMKEARESGSLMLYRNAALQLQSILNNTDLASLSRHFARTVGAMRSDRSAANRRS